MIAAWMLYSLVIATLLFASAIPAEFVCRALGRPTRFVWCAALVASVGLSALGLYQVEFRVAKSVTRQDAPVAASQSEREVSSGNPVASIAVAPRVSIIARTIDAARSVFALPDRLTSTVSALQTPRLDAALRVGAGVAAAAALVWLCFAAFSLRRLTRRCRSQMLDGHGVLVSDDVGPALVGVTKTWIVVPAWVLSMDESKRRVILAHEQQHADARDPLVLAIAAVLLALEVWNVALWAIVTRLRAAVESDCDQRVVRSHGDARGYGELLLAVYEQNASGLQRQLAFLGRESGLERRIRRIVERAPRLLSWRTASGLLASTLLVVAACETTAPTRTVPESTVVLARDSRGRAIESGLGMPRCLAAFDPAAPRKNGANGMDLDEIKSVARQRHPALFANDRGAGLVIGIVLDENCAVVRDTVVRPIGGSLGRGPNEYLTTAFGDTAGLAQQRGMWFVYGKSGYLTVTFAVKPSASWKAHVAGASCGFGARANEHCSFNGPLVLRLMDSVRVLIAVRGFEATNQPVERLFLIRLSRPIPTLRSQSMRHGIVATQGGDVYVEDFLATEPLLLFAPGKSIALSRLSEKRGVSVIRDLIGVAQYNGVSLTLEQVERLRPAKSCGGPAGACYEVGGIKIEFPA